MTFSGHGVKVGNKDRNGFKLVMSLRIKSKSLLRVKFKIRKINLNKNIGVYFIIQSVYSAEMCRYIATEQIVRNSK